MRSSKERAKLLRLVKANEELIAVWSEMREHDDRVETVSRKLRRREAACFRRVDGALSAIEAAKE